MNNGQLIPASAFVVTVTGTIASVEARGKLPSMNFWLGIGIAYMAIALLEEFNSELGSGAAVLVMVSALLINGEDIANYVGNKTKGKIGNKKSAAPKPPDVTVRRSGAVTRRV